MCISGGRVGANDLIQETDEKGYVMIEVRPAECIYGSCLDVILCKRDMCSTFVYPMLLRILNPVFDSYLNLLSIKYILLVNLIKSW